MEDRNPSILHPVSLASVGPSLWNIQVQTHVQTHTVAQISTVVDISSYMHVDFFSLEKV